MDRKCFKKKKKSHAMYIKPNNSSGRSNFVVTQVLSTMSEGRATFHFANILKMKMFEGPRTDQKRLLKPKPQLPQKE